MRSMRRLSARLRRRVGEIANVKLLGLLQRADVIQCWFFPDSNNFILYSKNLQLHDNTHDATHVEALVKTDSPVTGRIFLLSGGALLLQHFYGQSSPHPDVNSSILRLISTKR